jgi:hypothetical protein
MLYATTHNIANKGFSGNSSILPRSKFGVGGQDSSLQSLTAYSIASIVVRYLKKRETKCNKEYL